MSDPDNVKVLSEIRDLLLEQNRLVAAIKAQNEETAARNAEYMGKAEKLAQSQAAQNDKALGAIGNPVWFKWGFWTFLVLLLLIFLVPNLLR